jgi:hypothetical protein
MQEFILGKWAKISMAVLVVFVVAASGLVIARFALNKPAQPVNQPARISDKTEKKCDEATVCREIQSELTFLKSTFDVDRRSDIQAVEIFPSSAKKGWTTYRNLRHNFEISFPSNWKIKDTLSYRGDSTIAQKLELQKNADEFLDIHLGELGFGIFPTYDWKIRYNQKVGVWEVVETKKVEYDKDSEQSYDKSEFSQIAISVAEPGNLRYNEQVFMMFKAKNSSVDSSTATLKEIVKSIKYPYQQLEP